MSQEVGAHIYIGPWINWSHGVIRGATLTLSSRDGGLLTAFLGIFVTGAGASVWRILSYLIHQLRTSSEFEDGFLHQQQLILRNTGSSVGAAWQFFEMVFYWWKCARRPLLRALPLTMLALCNLLLFAVAGVFSSEVTKSAGNQTLIRSPNCGTWVPNATGNPLDQFAYTSKVLNDTINAASYARACYGNIQNVLQCDQYAQQQIKWTTNQNASCPFASGNCILGDTAAYEMDTGPVDSHDVLGINAPQDERITYRKVTTCAPIHTTGYVEWWNNTNVGEATYGDTFQRFFFGPIVNVSNYTYEYNEHTHYDNIGYDLESFVAAGGVDGNSWLPVPALNRTDADVTLFLLAPNSIDYISPVSDPFFSANTPLYIPFPGTNTTSTYYTTDYYIHAMGCIDQHQFCNPSNGECTPLTAYSLVSTASYKIGLSAVQQYTANRLSDSLMFVNVYQSVNGRGSSALLAADGVYQLTQGPLPDNQWMIEVNNWFAVGMAKLQQLVVQYAAGPSVLLEGAYLQRPTDAIGEAMCFSQKVRSPAGTISFSIVGVVIILVVGFILIVMNLCLSTFVGLLQNKFDMLGGDYKRLRWVLDDKLQLQRMAYEEVGMGVWKGGASAVPVTRMGDRFGVPRDVDRDHPRFGRGHGRVMGTGSGEGDVLIGGVNKAIMVEEVEQ